MKGNLKVFGALLLLTVVAIACNKDLMSNTEVQENAFIESDDVTFVSASKANKIANAFLGNLTHDLVTKSSIRLASIETIEDRRSENKPLMYVMNYVDGGFVIVSATKDY